MTIDALRHFLLPMPRELSAGTGRVVLRGRPLALQFHGSVSMPLLQPWRDLTERQAVTPSAEPGLEPLPVRVHCPTSRIPAPEFGDDESYRLELTPEGIRVEVTGVAALARARSTLVQILAFAESADAPPSVSCCVIDDGPALEWRGLMLDVARHFLPLPDLLRSVDGMAQFKLNVLHLHLTDDQAFRFASATYPQLAGPGEAYTREELEQLVAYAAARGIRVIPELDMPGHTTCWLAAYPEWALYPVDHSKRFGVHPACLNPCVDETYEVIGHLLDEFAEVFPDSYVHIGGDEVHPTWWRDHPDVQAYMAAAGMESIADLQVHFTRRVHELLRSRGKRLIGWDETQHAQLDASACIQAWRGMTARDLALRAGHDCIVSSPYYLDLFFNADQHTALRPELSASAARAAEDALLDDPRLAHVADGLAWTKRWRERTAPAASVPGRVLGAEACLWSELVDAETLDVRLWSRLPLLAELFWRGSSPTTSYTRLHGGLAAWHYGGGPDLTPALGGDLTLVQRRLLRPSGVTSGLTELLAVVEPVKWYGRLLGAQALAARLAGTEMPQSRPYDTHTKLRGIADISPQSFRAAQFDELLERWLVAPLSAAEAATLTDWLARWRRQYPAAQRLQSAAAGEPVAGYTTAPDLLQLAERLGLFADLLERHLLPQREQPLRTETLAALDPEFLRSLLKPAGELLLALVAPLLLRVDRARAAA